MLSRLSHFVRAAGFTQRRLLFSRAFSESSSKGSDAAFMAQKKTTLTDEELEGVFYMFDQDVKRHKVFLFMKGYPQAPECGFSLLVCKLLDYMGVEYGSRNILESVETREAIKRYSDWPTIPQLFVDGEFVGGSDIIRAMFESGELHDLMEKHGVEFAQEESTEQEEEEAKEKTE